MSIFDLDIPGDPDLKTEATLNPLKPEDAGPSIGAGFGKGLVLGVARGGAKAGRAISIAGQALPAVIDEATGGTDAADWYQENVLKPTDTAVDYYTPRAGDVGKAGQIIGGLGEIVLPLAATLGNPALLVGSEALNTERNLTQQGVDPQTASEAGLVQGVATAVGFKLPFLGSTLATRMASGAGGNLAVNAGSTAVQAELLKAGGYDKQAAQFDPLDSEARIIDLLTGVAFGGLAHVTAPRAPDAPSPLQPSEQAAILTANNGKHFQQDTAPGVPADLGASTTHQRAMEMATDQLTQGKAVNLDGVITGDSKFLPRQQPAVKALTEAIRNANRQDLPVGLRWAPSQRLASLPLDQRRTLRYDAPELNEHAAAIERQYGLPGGLINALKNAGERSNSNQVSPAGAAGVMQFMPANLKKYGVTDATDPVQMIDAAGRYLRDTLKQYGGNVDAVIADYNGGPRQAREVLAGRLPKAKETRDYLQRVRTELGRDVPSPDMPLARTADEFPVIPAEQARYAKAIEDEIQSVEGSRADLMTVAAGMADLGEVSRVRAEIAPLTERRQMLDADTALRDIAKEIQAAKPRTSYKQALAQAETQRASEITELDARIGRLEGFLQQNTEANQAAQQLAQLDEQITLLRENRGAIEVPAAVLSPVADAVRSAIESMPARTGQRLQAVSSSQAEPVRTSAQKGADPAPSGRAGAADAGTAPMAGAEPTTRAQPTDLDIELAQEALAAVDDIRLPTGAVDTEGNPVTVSARELMAEADADIQRAQQESSGFMAAVTCFLQRGT